MAAPILQLIGSPGGGGAPTAAASEYGQLPTDKQITGNVKVWYDDKGFGFLIPSDGGPDVFVHRSQLTDGQLLVQGSTVNFTPMWNDAKGKYHAANVIGAAAASAIPGMGVEGGLPSLLGKGGKVDRTIIPASTNLFVAGLPKEIEDTRIAEIFSAYGTLTQLKVLPDSGRADRAALMRFADIAQAKWIVDNLNGNIALGLTEPLTVRFADNRAENAKALGIPKGGSVPMGAAYGKAAGVSGDNQFSPYGAGKGPAMLGMGTQAGEIPATMLGALTSALPGAAAGGDLGAMAPDFLLRQAEEQLLGVTGACGGQTAQSFTAPQTQSFTAPSVGAPAATMPGLDELRHGIQLQQLLQTAGLTGM